MGRSARVWKLGRWACFHRRLKTIWLQPERSWLPFRIQRMNRKQPQNSLERSRLHTIRHP